MTAFTRTILVISLLSIPGLYCTAEETNLYDKWPQGLRTDTDYFPLGVWLQEPIDALLWKNAGINLYIGLWEGPTPQQLEILRNAEMQVIAEQNDTALQYRLTKLSDGRPLITGYLLPDEPDNCQACPGGWCEPIPTSVIQQQYADWKNNDPNRPILLGLSQGIAWDSMVWLGQGGYIVPERDYPAYITGSDMTAFDIYPMDCARTATCGQAWRVSLGIDRLYQFSPPNHIVWNTLETSDINANGIQVTTQEIRAEAWMSIIHGSKGLIYFIHGKSSIKDFDPRTLLRPENADRLAAFTRINQEIQQLAPVINSPTVEGLVSMDDIDNSSPVDYAVHFHEGMTYIFAAGMRQEITMKQFNLPYYPDTMVDVIGEDRHFMLTNTAFTDTFNGYQSHLYQIHAAIPAGDFNSDNHVDIRDFCILSESWQTQNGQSGWNPRCDISKPGNGLIDLADFAVMMEFWLDKRLDTLPTGDFNSDWQVNIQDLSILSQTWLTHSGLPQWNWRCDIAEPKDNYIDLADLAVLIENWLVNN